MVKNKSVFSFRKLSVGLVSATISSLFFMSVLANSSVDAQETTGGSL